MKHEPTGKSPPPGAAAALVVAPKRRLSQVFLTLAAKASGPVTIGAIRDAMGDRGFAMLLVLFAALNLLPLPPGTTVILGLPLLLVSAQLALGYPSAWLPGFLLSRAIAPNRFRRSVGMLVPRLERMERLVKPRHWPFSNNVADRFIGIVTFILALAVTLPIPFGNWLPAFSIAVIGLAVSERDGLLLAAGLGLSLLSLAVIAIVVGTAGAVAGTVLSATF